MWGTTAGFRPVRACAVRVILSRVQGGGGEVHRVPTTQVFTRYLYRSLTSCFKTLVMCFVYLSIKLTCFVIIVLLQVTNHCYLSLRLITVVLTVTVFNTFVLFVNRCSYFVIDRRLFRTFLIIY